MRVLLLGAGGMLARDLAASVPLSVDLVSRTQAELDVTDAAALQHTMSDVRPDAVLNAAGYTAVDRAEREPEAAYSVNGTAPGLIGQAARTVGALVVHFSTDYVLGGPPGRALTESDPVAPLGVYAESKLRGEKALADSGAQYLVVRSQWLFGLHGRSFPRTMWERARAGQSTRVVNDQFGRPTYTVDLADAIWKLLRTGRAPLVPGPAFGTVHIANTGVATWYDVALRVFRAAGAEALLAPCTTADYPTPARRPAWSVLDTTRYETYARTALPSWTDALDRFLKELGEEGRGKREE